MAKYINEYKEVIRNEKSYIKVLSSSELPEKKGYLLAFEDDIDMEVSLFRINGELYCLSNICLHRHAREIYKGIIRGDTVTCPLHGWTYNYKTGINVNSKQGSACLKTYEIFEEKNFIYIEKPVVKIPKWRDLNYDYNLGNENAE